MDETLAVLIIFGTRHYGVVDRHGGQYACTRVFHLYFLPIIPLGTMWVTAEHGDAVSGHKVAFYGRSIAAAFLRPWGLAFGIMAGLGGIGELNNGRIGSGVGLLVVAATLLALAIRSFRQRTVRGVRASRQRDMGAPRSAPRAIPRLQVRKLGRDRSPIELAL